MVSNTSCSSLLPVLVVGSLLAAPPLVAQERLHKASASAPRPGTIFLYPERIPLEDGSLLEAERGLLFVPMTRRDTSRGVVSVEVWRFRAQQPSTLPPVFRLPGGPGFEGLEDDIDQDYYQNVVEPYTRLQDYVVVGQRGIGRSKPTTLCPIGEPGGPATFSRRCRAYWEAKGLEVNGFTVMEAAADVADVAAALGYERVVIRGGSFGSHWAMAVMHYHPELVAWAILSGTEGPDHTYDSPSGVLRALKRVAASAEQDPNLATLIPPSGLISALDSVRVRLASAPVTMTITDSASEEEHALEYTEDDVPFWSTLGVRSRQGVATWPEHILRLYYGDFETIAEHDAQLMVRSAQGEGRPDYTTASQYLLDCASGITPERLALLKNDPAQALVSVDYAWYEEICAPWEVDVGNAFRRGFKTDVPTVIVHGTWDIVTPLDNALELMPHFSRGKLVTVVGGTHGALGEALSADSAFVDAFWKFLQTGDVAPMPDSVVLPPIDWVVSDQLKELAASSRRNDE